MYCSQCGKEISDSSLFCNMCGTDLKNINDKNQIREHKSLKHTKFVEVDSRIMEILHKYVTPIVIGVIVISIVIMGVIVNLPHNGSAEEVTKTFLKAIYTEDATLLKKCITENQLQNDKNIVFKGNLDDKAIEGVLYQTNSRFKQSNGQDWYKNIKIVKTETLQNGHIKVYIETKYKNIWTISVWKANGGKDSKDQYFITDDGLTNCLN